MPYVSDWKSIPEACAHIASVEGCDAISALKQLRSAYRDGKIRTDRQWKTGEQLKVLRRDVLKIWPGPTGEASRPKPARPTAAQLDAWMRDNYRKGDKREPIIKDCCAQTGARWRDAVDAYKRLPSSLKRTRGQRGSF